MSPSESDILLADIGAGRSGDDLETRQQRLQKRPPPISSTTPENTVSVTRSDSSSNISNERGGSSATSQQNHAGPTTEYEGDPWLPGIWRQLPYIGILSLIGCLLSISASIIILVVSNGKPTSAWAVSPAVYLALLMTANNMLSRFAFHEGVKIAWWYKALRGSTIKELHYTWAYGDGLWSAIVAGRNFNLVSLGSIAVTLMVIDQPLIQRASNVITVQKTALVNVTVPIAPEIPWGFSAYEPGRGTTGQVMTQPMISAFSGYNSQASIMANFTGCAGTCKGYIEAGGLAAKCKSTIGPVQYYPSRAFKNSGVQPSPFSANFMIGLAADDASSYINMNIAYTDNAAGAGYYNCPGTRTERNCYLAPATLRYPVTFTGNTVILDDSILNGTVTAFQPSPLAYNNGSNIDQSEFGMWTIGGLYLAASTLFSSDAFYESAVGTIYPILPDILSNQFLDFSTSTVTYQNLSSIPNPKTCGQNWTDPTSHIISALNNMAFRLSLLATGIPFRNTTTPPASQVVLMSQTMNVNVYSSNYRYLIANTVLTTMMVLFIFPTLWGWWHLGRNMSLNPIEIAKSFDAEILNQGGSNEGVGDLVKRIGHSDVKYGEVDKFDDGRRTLKMAGVQTVARPIGGISYS